MNGQICYGGWILFFVICAGVDGKLQWAEFLRLDLWVVGDGRRRVARFFLVGCWVCGFCSTTMVNLVF